MQFKCEADKYMKRNQSTSMSFYLTCTYDGIVSLRMIFFQVYPNDPLYLTAVHWLSEMLPHHSSPTDMGSSEIYNNVSIS